MSPHSAAGLARGAKAKGGGSGMQAESTNKYVLLHDIVSYCVVPYCIILLFIVIL